MIASETMSMPHRIHSGAWRASATTQRMDDLDDIPIRDDMGSVTAARDDLAVHFHGDPAFGQALGGEQFGEGAGGGQGEQIAVESDIHAGIVARGCGGCPDIPGLGLPALESPMPF